MQCDSLMNLSLCVLPNNQSIPPALLSSSASPPPRCVMKMDHHCPWINNCCGHLNHAYFTSFLLLAPLGCSHAAIIFIMTMYTQLYERVSGLLSSRLLSTDVSFIWTFHSDVTTHVRLFFFFFLSLTADIIRLEHRENWHECCASVPASHALQCTRLCCHTLCLRLSTGHYYCCWHAFLHTGKFFSSEFTVDTISWLWNVIFNLAKNKSRL